MSIGDLVDQLAHLRLSEANKSIYTRKLKGFVNANVFAANSDAVAYRYHVRMQVFFPNGKDFCLTERKSKRDSTKDLVLSHHELQVNYLIFSDAYYKSLHFGVEGMLPVYDNRSIMYSPCELKPQMIILEGDDIDHAKPFYAGTRIVVEIIKSSMGVLKLTDSRFFDGRSPVGREDHDLRSFYELLATQGAQDDGECSTVNNETYIVKSQQPYALGICFLSGFKKNVRVSDDNGNPVVKVTVDPITTAFYQPQYLADALHNFSNGNYSLDVVQRFLALFKNVRVYLKFKKGSVMVIQGFSDIPLRDISFERDGRHLSVIDYFADRYDFHSNADDMPALEVRLRNGEIAHYPLDCLVILRCQKLPMAKFSMVNANFHDVILRRNAEKPEIRFQKTDECFAYIEKSKDIFKGFGIQFYRGSNQIEMGMRGRPGIETANGIVKPDEKSRFNMSRSPYVDAATCKKWIVLNGSKEADLSKYIDQILSVARSHGLKIPAPDVVRFNSSAAPGIWVDQFEQLVEHDYEFIFLIDDRKATASHDMLKACELGFGIQTQHVHIETLQKRSAFENIVNKLNMKLDGLNYRVVLEPCNITNIWNDDRIFVIGYDVAHPASSSNDGLISPSVVGVSFNACRQAQSFNGNYFFQNPNQENVDRVGLFRNVCCGLKMRKAQRPNAPLPALIFVYRDGLSEGQISMAKNDELRTIRDAVNHFYKTENIQEKTPKFVMVLATKRHNRRFYSENRSNVLPGTVASNGIARMGAVEFYMQSAFPLQGTAKLTDYEVIANDAKQLSLNDIQSFTHAMCYHHQIVNSAVSLPEPIFQAHELAKRGTKNFRRYRDISNVPLIIDGTIDYDQLNEKFTYFGNGLVLRRFTA